jgi:ubiquitin-protein ligase
MSAKPKTFVFKEAKKKLTYLDDDAWSDEESDYLVHPPAAEPKDTAVEDMKSRGDKTMTKIFSGQAKIIYNADNFDSPEKSIPKEFICEIPLPYVPPHVAETLGEDTVKLMWTEFVRFGADETELLLTEHIQAVANLVNESLGYDLPFDKLTFTMGDNEYTDFGYVTKSLARLRNDAGVMTPEVEKVAQLPKCCANIFCRRHRLMETRILSGEEDRPDFRLDVVYRRWIQEKRGYVRINHVPAILEECEIAHDVSRAPEGYWQIRGDRICYTYEELEECADMIRLDAVDRSSQVDLYRLPKWLLNEFSPSEVSMFRHHFMMIDIDCGGTLDSSELMLLGDSLGNKLTEEECQHLIDQHDDDGSGTIDFEEFMTLMFQLMRGTINVESDALAQAMMESKNQIKIFEEIEDIKHNPPELVSVHSYGGNPVECQYLLQGPPGSLYEGGHFLLKITYVNGYPFSCPEVCIMTRMVHLNFIVQMNGWVSIPHMRNLWESSWSSREVIKHVLELMIEPNPAFLPLLMIDVFNAFMVENFDIEDESVLIRSAFSDKLETGLLGDKVKTNFAFKLNKLPRLEQMHMNIVSKYYTDNEGYEAVVRQFVEKFANDDFGGSAEGEEEAPGEEQE